MEYKVEKLEIDINEEVRAVRYAVQYMKDFEERTFGVYIDEGEANLVCALLNSGVIKP